MALTVTWEAPLRSGRYRHMAKRDAIVWERWLDRYAGAAVAIAYDVALGGQRPTGDWDPETLDAWQYVTALKVDVAVMMVDRVEVLEVRPHATVSALGAALCYALVADRERLWRVPIQPGIVCESIHPDVRWVADRLGVVVYEV
jgi:hypothetical protein